MKPSLTVKKMNNMKLYKAETGAHICNIITTYGSRDLIKIKGKKLHILNLKAIESNFDFQIISNSKVIQIWDSDIRKVNPELIYKYGYDIKVLNLIDTKFSEDLEFAKLTNLEELEFNHQKKTRFNNCLNLRSIKIRKTPNLELDFSKLPKIEIIEIIQGKVKRLSNLESCKNLKALTLYNCKLESEIDFSALLRLDSIEYIHLKNYSKKVPMAILYGLKGLKCLILENCANVSLKSLELDELKFKTRIIGKSNLEKSVKNSLKNISSNCTYGYFLKDRYLDKQLNEQ